MSKGTFSCQLPTPAGFFSIDELRIFCNQKGNDAKLGIALVHSSIMEDGKIILHFINPAIDSFDGLRVKITNTLTNTELLVQIKGGDAVFNLIGECRCPPTSISVPE